ncbi:MAG: hypothetical protein HJJLKODD_00570 [Phycisphaerae bacterium]|nr:hypothetical protein [Phycisphaerae bacterium]
MKKSPSTNGANGRDSSGRFMPGNPGGPGNPYAQQVAAWRGVLVNTVKASDIKMVVQRLVKAAKNGESWAVRELLDRTLGKTLTTGIESYDEPTPEEIIDPELVERVIVNAARRIQERRGKEKLATVVTSE